MGQYAWLQINKKVTATNFHSSVVRPLQLMIENINETKDDDLLKKKLSLLGEQLYTDYYFNTGNTQIITSTYDLVSGLDDKIN